jgi:hypothetical protein
MTIRASLAATELLAAAVAPMAVAAAAARSGFVAVSVTSWPALTIAAPRALPTLPDPMMATFLRV